VKVVAVVQARLGSTRLPAKVLADLGGDTMLARVVQRVRAARTIDEVVIATTTAESDDPIIAECARLGVASFRGSEQNVLSRYVGAATEAAADVVVRMTSDCPLLDPEVIDAVVCTLGDAPISDYASNTHVRSYPRGLDVEAMTMATLVTMHARAQTAPEREHVTTHLMLHPEAFAIRQVCAAHDDSDLRWTVDTLEDLALVRALYARFDLGKKIVPYRQVVVAVRSQPELFSVNANIQQKSWRGDHVS
jgi:spore coat polysaccharide biosynthesis protein SpsF